MNNTRLSIKTQDGVDIEFPETHHAFTLYFDHPNGSGSICQIPFNELANKIWPDNNFNEIQEKQK